MGVTSGQAIARDLRMERGGGGALSTLERQVITRIGELTDQKADLRKLPNSDNRARLFARLESQIGHAYDQLRQLDKRAERFKPAPPDRPTGAPGGATGKDPGTPDVIREQLAANLARYRAEDPQQYDADAEAFAAVTHTPVPGPPAPEPLRVVPDPVDPPDTRPDRYAAGSGATGDQGDPAAFTGREQLAAMTADEIAEARKYNMINTPIDSPYFRK